MKNGSSDYRLLKLIPKEGMKISDFNNLMKKESIPSKGTMMRLLSDYKENLKKDGAYLIKISSTESEEIEDKIQMNLKNFLKDHESIKIEDYNILSKLMNLITKKIDEKKFVMKKNQTSNTLTDVEKQFVPVNDTKSLFQLCCENLRENGFNFETANLQKEMLEKVYKNLKKRSLFDLQKSNIYSKDYFSKLFSPPDEKSEKAFEEDETFEEINLVFHDITNYLSKFCFWLYRTYKNTTKRSVFDL